MFIRCKKCHTDGKEHLYWSVVENRRISGQRVLQRQVLYLGELNGRQEAAWGKTVECFGHDPSQHTRVALFDENHAPAFCAGPKSVRPPRRSPPSSHSYRMEQGKTDRMLMLLALAR